MKKLTLSLLVLIAAQPALAQVAGTPEEAQKQELSPAEKTVVAAMMAYYVRDARDLCGFKLTAFADRMVAGLEKFPMDEQKALAQTLSNKNRPRAPLAQFCKTAREEIEHSPTKWFAD